MQSLLINVTSRLEFDGVGDKNVCKFLGYCSIATSAFIRHLYVRWRVGKFSKGMELTYSDEERQ